MRTTVSPHHDHRRTWVQPLDAAACWARIANATEGRLELHTGSGDRSLVTRYRPRIVGTVLGIVLAVPSHSIAYRYAVGQRVSFEIDGRDDDGGTWTVRIAGLSRALEQSEVVAFPDYGGTVPIEQHDRYLYLAVGHIGGSVAHPLDNSQHVGSGARSD